MTGTPRTTEYRGAGKQALLAALLCLAACGPARAAEAYRPLAGVVHVHTGIGSGDQDLSALVLLAKQAGLEAMVVTDHDRQAMEYGIWPFQGVIRKKEERGSIAVYGAQRYLDDIARINREQNCVVVVPGTQCSPFYYWTGRPWSGLTGHDFHRELLIIGMEKALGYEGIPELGGELTLRNVKTLWRRSLLFLLPLAAGLYFAARKDKRARSLGTVLLALGAMALWSNHPFSASRFDAYHGDQGIAPYQDAIDWADRNGGLVFWSHPESAYADGGVKLGPVTLQTRKHPEVLLSSRGYTGFCALYGDTTAAEAPGTEWDQALMEYCRGERERPVWAVAEADYHDKDGGTAIDDFTTIFFTAEKSVAGIRDAMARGRMYAVRKSGGPSLRLDGFSARDAEGGGEALMGGELAAKGEVRLSGTVFATDGGAYPVTCVLVKDGVAWQTFSGDTPQAFSFADRPGKARSFYRLLVRGTGAHRIVSNPVFARAAGADQ